MGRIFSEKVGWIDIKEKSPEDKQMCLVKFGPLPVMFKNVRFAWYSKAQRLFYSEPPDVDEMYRGFIAQEIVTIWMPIPRLMSIWEED